MGWSREKVRDFLALRNICGEAWEIVGATLDNLAPSDLEDNAPDAGAIAPFTEGLLRSIVSLNPDQQVELVKKLAGND